MTLPPQLEFGSHRLQLMTVSRSADDVLDARRCSDHALTAFCYVGELQGSSGESGVLWYYSPLFQFERKKIRVEESVIASALSKAVAQQQQHQPQQGSGSTADSATSRRVFVDATSAPSASSSLAGTDEDGEGPRRERGRRSAVPGIFIRLGKSTTFREYKLVSSTELQAEKATGAVDSLRDGVYSEEATVSVEKAAAVPLLSPMRPTRPSLTLQHCRFGSFSARRPLLRRDGVNNFMSGPSTPHVASSGSGAGKGGGGGDGGAAASLTARPAVEGEGEEEQHSAFSPASAAAPRSPQAPSTVLTVPQGVAASTLCESPEPASRFTLNGPTASSLSSAFLSTSNFPSGRVSRLPTSAMSTARSPGAESVGADGVDAPVLLREPLLLTSAVSTPDVRTPLGPSPPSSLSQRARTPRRPPLRAQVSRAQSDYGGQSRRGEQDEVRAGTPPAMRVM